MSVTTVKPHHQLLLRRNSCGFSALLSPSHLSPCGNSSQNTHSENQANLPCSGLNTDFTKCTAFREYSRAERSITRRRANHPQPPSAQPTHQNRPHIGLQRTSSKIVRRFNRGNMAVETAFGSKPSLGGFRCTAFDCFLAQNQYF